MLESANMVPDCVSQVGPQPPLLNVIFHGPFLFIYYPTRVEVVTPDTPEHLVVAGTWLGEKLCHPGTFFLTGIKTKQNPFDPTKLNQDTHAIISQSTINVEQGSYYRFILPYPSCEKALALTETIDPAKIFVGDYKGNIKAKSFGTVHVLSYKLCKNVDAPELEDTPQLEGLQWRPEPSPYGHWEWYCDDHSESKTRLVTPYSFATNLHVYAEAAFEPDPNHPIRDFSQMVAMLPGLKLGLAQRFPDADLKFPDPADCDYLGIVREEQGGLRGLPPPDHPPFRPPLVCDAPSLVVVGAKDSP
jgi:hypothetical protein